MTHSSFSPIQLIVTTLLMAALLVTGCTTSGGIQTTNGSGALKTESIEVSGFSAMVSTNSGTVTVQFGDKESLTIETDENILPLLESKVENGRLVLSTKPNTSINPTKLDYRITLKNLDNLEVTGSGEMAVEGFALTSLKVLISGSGSITLNGKTDRLEVMNSGSGALMGKDLVCREARIDSSGSGVVNLTVSEKLDATISGAGIVTYYGDPQVIKNITGSGSVNKG